MKLPRPPSPSSSTASSRTPPPPLARLCLSGDSPDGSPDDSLSRSRDCSRSGGGGGLRSSAEAARKLFPPDGGDAAASDDDDGGGNGASGAPIASTTLQSPGWNASLISEITAETDDDGSGPSDRGARVARVAGERRREEENNVPERTADDDAELARRLASLRAERDRERRDRGEAEAEMRSRIVAAEARVREMEVDLRAKRTELEAAEAMVDNYRDAVRVKNTAIRKLEAMVRSLRVTAMEQQRTTPSEGDEGSKKADADSARGERCGACGASFGRRRQRGENDASLLRLELLDRYRTIASLRGELELLRERQGGAAAAAAAAPGGKDAASVTTGPAIPERDRERPARWKDERVRGGGGGDRRPSPATPSAARDDDRRDGAAALERLGRENQALSARLAQTEDELMKLRADLRERESDKITLTEQLSLLRNEAVLWEAERNAVAELRSSLAASEQMAYALRNELSEREGQVRELRELRERIREKDEEAKGTREASAARSAMQKDEIDKLTMSRIAQVTELESERESLCRQLAERDKELSALRRRLSRYAWGRRQQQRGRPTQEEEGADNEEEGGRGQLSSLSDSVSESLVVTEVEEEGTDNEEEGSGGQLSWSETVSESLIVSAGMLCANTEAAIRSFERDFQSCGTSDWR